MGKILAIVGMCGAGKSVVSDALVEKGYQYLRFGQITMDILKEKGLEVNEANEKAIREGIRKEHGMGAYAILNMPKIDSMLEKGNIIADGLYSWTEYKILKEKYKDKLFVVCIYAPPALRYKRLAARTLEADDKNMKNRPMTEEQAKSRDKAEIENIEKGGPIAMADYTLVNTGTVQDLTDQLEKVLGDISD